MSPALGARLPRLAAVLGLTALAGLAVFNRGAPWRGEWAWSVDAALGSTVLTGPGVAALAAWWAAAARRRASLTDPTPRGWLVPIRLAVGAWAVAATVFVLTLATTLLLTATTAHGGPLPWWITPMGLLLLAAYSSLGAALGHLWPTFASAPAAAIGTFGLGLAGALGVGPSVLRQGPATGTLAGVTWDPTVAAGQAAVLLAVAILAAAATVASRGRRPLPVRLVLGLSALGVVAGALVLQTHGDERFELSGEAASTCGGRAPEVCVAPSNTRALASLSSRMGALATELTSVGLPVPDAYSQLLPSAPPPAGHGMFSLPGEANSPVTPWADAADALTRPAACPAWFAAPSPPPEAFEARYALQVWILDRAGRPAPSAFSPSERRWRAAPLADQLHWVRPTFDALRTCDLDRLRPPWEGT